MAVMTSFRRTILICILAAAISGLASAQGRNSIEGRVVGSNGSGIADARVTLKNTNYSDVGQDITDAMGNYRFNSVSDGIYYIEIEPLGTGYERQTRRVQLVSLSQRSGGSAEVYNFDFQLRPLQPVEKPMPKELAAKLLFVQEVPPAAVQKYKEAQKFLENDKKKEAYASLRTAIETFPDYYDALDALGTEYLNAGWFDVAVPLFRQAVDVNSKGWHAYSGLGAAYGGLKMRKEAIAALKKSIDLNPLDVRTHLRLGGELAKDADSLDEAIKAFRNAIKLDSGDISAPYAALASLYSRLGRYGEAADALES